MAHHRAPSSSVHRGLRRLLLLGVVTALPWVPGAPWVATAGAATLPYVIDMTCVAGTGNIGAYWISLPVTSPLQTAEGLCSVIPYAQTVTQRFPADDGVGTSPEEYTYDCVSHACSASPLSPPYPEASCPPGASSCFCIDKGEGFEVRVSQPSSLLVTGSETTVSLALNPSMKMYLVSVPYENSFTNINSLAAGYGLPTTGALRGIVSWMDPCTGVLTSVQAGTAAGVAAQVVPGRAYRLRWPSTAPVMVTNPTTANPDHDQDGILDPNDPCTDTDQDGYGNPGYAANTCTTDNCPAVANPSQNDPDKDGRGDECDNCPNAFNPSQADLDHNGAGDACDPIHDLGVSISYNSAPSRTPCPQQPLKYCATYWNRGTLAETAAGARFAIGTSTFTPAGAPPTINCSTIAAVPTITQTSNATSVQLQLLWDQAPFEPGQQCTVCLSGTVSGALGQSVPADSSIYQDYAALTQDPVTSPLSSANDASVSAYISCSFDPNDKSVEPKGCGLPGLTRPGTPLKYVIRFQNLGNAPAFDVVVKDRLDPGLDLGTLALLDTSHLVTSVTLDADRQLTWTFRDINLPAAADDEPGSHGFVSFAATPLADLPSGSAIHNGAAIYFDFNPAVLTNDVVNTITTNPTAGGEGTDPEICNGIDDDCDGSVDEEPEASNSCNSGNVCSQPATCVNGACSAAPAIDCADGNVCTDDRCDFYTGCFNPDNNAPCEDNDACTVGDTCGGGTCQPGGPRDSDGDAHVDPACGGDDCNDLDGSVWSGPLDVAGLVMTSDTPPALDWSSQAGTSGPGTLYDAVSGTLAPTIGGTDYSSAGCLGVVAAPFADGRPDPEPGSAYWYLVRARNSCGAGTYGTPARDGGIPACP